MSETMYECPECGWEYGGDHPALDPEMTPYHPVKTTVNYFTVESGVHSHKNCPGGGKPRVEQPTDLINVVETFLNTVDGPTRMNARVLVALLMPLMKMRAFDEEAAYLNRAVSDSRLSDHARPIAEQMARYLEGRTMQIGAEVLSVVGEELGHRRDAETP